MTAHQKALGLIGIGGAVLLGGGIAMVRGWSFAIWVAVFGGAVLLRGVIGALALRDDEDAAVLALRFQLLVITAISIGAMGVGIALLVVVQSPGGDDIAVGVFALAAGTISAVLSIRELLRT